MCFYFVTIAVADAEQVRAIMAVVIAKQDPAALRMEQLNDQVIGPILEETETGKHPE
jgi:hypothetical protein